MGLASCLLSLLLHISLIVIAVYAPWGAGDIRVDLDQPVYEVELVRMPEQKKAVQVPRTSGEQIGGQKKAQNQVKTLPKQQPRAKPAPSKPAKPEPVQIAKEDEKPRAAQTPQKKETTSKEPPKPKSREEVKTPERELEEALQDISSQAKQEAQDDEDDLHNVLAQLKQDASEQGLDAEHLGRSSSVRGTESVYGALVRERIQANWRFPDLGQEEDLQAIVQIRINDQGEIRDYSLERSSGNPQFDSSVLRAVARTRSLQAPPNPELRTVRITFYLQDMMP